MYITVSLYSIHHKEICKKFDIGEKVNKSRGYLIFIHKTLKTNEFMMHIN